MRIKVDYDDDEGDDDDDDLFESPLSPNTIAIFKQQNIEFLNDFTLQI